METYKKGELAKKVLLTAAAGGAIAAVCVMPGLGILFKSFNARHAKERYRVKRSVQALEQKRYLIRSIINGKEQLIVSEAGKEKLWLYLAEDLTIPRPKKWDKKWRIVSFDIPETKEKIRREVSWKIKDIGMVAIQHSVFVCPFPCKQEVNKIVNHYDVKKFFMYAEAGMIESDRDLLQWFGLK